MFIPTGSPEARSSEGVEAARDTVRSKVTSMTDYTDMNISSVILHLFTERSRSVPPRLAHPSLLLLSKKPTDGRLDAFLLTGLVKRVLAAVGAAAIC